MHPANPSIPDSDDVISAVTPLIPTAFGYTHRSPLAISSIYIPIYPCNDCKLDLIQVKEVRIIKQGITEAMSADRHLNQT